GCPVVSTPTGARGLAVRNGEHLVVTPDDHDDSAFAAAVISLATADARRIRLAAAARRFVADYHNRSAIGDELARLVTEIAK
ncbi:MAG: glycosyltransferase, partial [Nitrososphaerales archaeon]